MAGGGRGGSAVGHTTYPEVEGGGGWELTARHTESDSHDEDNDCTHWGW
jgi:hypothetical protein